MRALLLPSLILASSMVAQTPYDANAFAGFARQEHPHGATERSGGPPGRGFDMKYLRCAWQLDPAVRFISGTVTSYFTATADGLAQLSFDLSDSLVVDQVMMHGSPASFAQQPGDLLVITLPGPMAAGELDSVEVAYHGIPPNTGFGSFVNEHHSGTPIVWTLSEPYGAKDWWPAKQDLNDKVDSLDTYVTTPMAYRAAGNGLLMPPDTAGGQVTWHWRHRHPIDYYLIGTAVTNYQVDVQYAVVDGDSIPVESYAYPEDFDNAVSNATELLPKIVLYSQLFGTYPFADEKYGQARFGWGGGMEHQTMTFLGVYHPEISAHELAHHWFGDKVTCGSWQDIWLNEGFATYLAGLAYEYLSPVWWPVWKRQLVDNITSEAGGSVFCTDTVDQGRLFSSRLTYNKGAMVVHMLRWICGDSAFYQGLRDYLNDPALAYGTARTSDLKAHLEAASGLDLTGFFNDWYTGEGYPVYSLEWTQDGSGLVNISLSQTPSDPSVDFFELPVPVRFYGGGTDSTVVLDNTVNGQAFSFHLPWVADSMEFDPDTWLVCAHNVAASVHEAAGGSARLTVHPNPAGDRLAWGLPAGFSGRALVRDLRGRLVLSADAAQGSMDIQALAPGAYLLELRNDRDVRQVRFIKR